MARKKPKTRKKPPTRRKPARKRKPASRKKRAAKTRPPAKRGKTVRRKRPARTVRRRRPAATRLSRRAADLFVEEPLAARGLGPEAGGQSGDTEELSRDELADSESVEELVEEGQAFEAGVISGVENAPEADRGEVRTRQVPEDDVPPEYLDED